MDLLKREFNNELVPGPVEYAVLLPNGHQH